MERFGEVIRSARKKLGLSLETVARRIHSHKGYISGMETGKVNPGTPKVVKRLASTLKLNPEDLILRSYVEKAPREIRDRLMKATFPDECGS